MGSELRYSNKFLGNDYDVAGKGLVNALDRHANTVESVSSLYYEYMLTGFRCSQRNRSKAVGQFFTPAAIYVPMIKEALNCVVANSCLTIADPFCGDGRLLAETIRQLQDRGTVEALHITAWDIDESILPQAKASIEESANEVSMDVSLSIAQYDALTQADAFYGKFDLVVTNPPWTSTKSLKSHAFETKDAYAEYQRLACLYATELSIKHPEAKPVRAFGAGTVNLSRFGMALSIKLLNDEGVCGIVMPSSFTADTSSASLREFVFAETETVSIHYYPAELKLFEGADQAGVSIVLAKQGKKELARVISHGESNANKEYVIDTAFWDYSKQSGYSVPLGYSSAEIRLIEKLSKLTTLGETKSIRLGREVDETRIKERLCRSSQFRFIKGFMVLNYDLTEDEKWFYDPSKAPIPPTAKSEKVVWRDISRVSQAKRIKATLVPAGFVAGNSLGVATCADSKMLRAFLGVLNSEVFELIARTVLTTNHVSAGSLRRLPFPSMSHEQVGVLADAVDKVLAEPSDAELLLNVERLVAEAFNLTDNEFEIVRNAVKNRIDAYME